jgi:small subunit ribosomal protein S6e
MKFNISCPETGRNKIVELQNEEKMNELIDKKIGNEVEGSIINELFNGYTFKITGGFDKDGFAMKNGILTQGRKRILLKKGDKNFRFRKGYHREGVRKRKLVRGCIVSPDIRVLHLKITKVGPTLIPGLTEQGSELPKRLGPKRANNILKQLGIVDIYNKKKKNPEERKTLRFMITKFAPKRTVTTANGKTYVKRPKIQRLITPERLRRKRNIKRIKEERRKETEEQMKNYRDTLKRLRNNTKKSAANTAAKKTTTATKTK